MVNQSKTMFKAALPITCTRLLKFGGSKKKKNASKFFNYIGYKGEVYNLRYLGNDQPEQKLHSRNSLICKIIIEVVSNYS